MKYMLLIHQGAAPTPRSSEEWGSLSEDEQKAIYGAYKAINETPGVSPGLRLQPPEAATTVRLEDGQTAGGTAGALLGERISCTEAAAGLPLGLLVVGQAATALVQRFVLGVDPVLNVALPSIREDLGASFTDLQRG